jgi:hypothetical protein
VIALLALLLATTVDGADEARRRARLNEVTNRLGVRVEPPARDLRSVMLRVRGDIVAAARAALSRTRMGVPGRGAERTLAELVWLLWHGPQRAVDDLLPVHQRNLWSWGSDPFGVINPMVPILPNNEDEPEKLLLPEVGLRNPELERYTAWIAREIDRGLLERWIEIATLPPRPSATTRSEVVHPMRQAKDFVNAEVETRRRRLQEHWPSLMDWVEATGSDLYRYDLEGAIAASHAWHDQFKGKAGYREATSRGIVWVRWPDGATIERLVTAKLLEEEGDSMGHCVGGYWSEVRDGNSIVYSYRDPQGIPQATLEVDSGEVSETRGETIQLQGPDDGPITDPLARLRMTAFIKTLSLYVSNQVRGRIDRDVDIANAPREDIDLLTSREVDVTLGIVLDDWEENTDGDEIIRQETLTEWSADIVDALIAEFDGVPCLTFDDYLSFGLHRHSDRPAFDVAVHDHRHDNPRTLGWIEVKLIPPTAGEDATDVDAWRCTFVVHDSSHENRWKDPRPRSADPTIGTFPRLSEALFNETWFSRKVEKAVEAEAAAAKWEDPADAGAPQDELVRLGLVTVRKARGGDRHEIAAAPPIGGRP